MHGRSADFTLRVLLLQGHYQIVDIFLPSNGQYMEEVPFLIHPRVMRFILQGNRGSAGSTGQPGSQGPPVSGRFCLCYECALREKQFCDEILTRLDQEQVRWRPQQHELVMDRNSAWRTKRFSCFVKLPYIHNRLKLNQELTGRTFFSKSFSYLNSKQIASVNTNVHFINDILTIVNLTKTYSTEVYEVRER